MYIFIGVPEADAGDGQGQIDNEALAKYLGLDMLLVSDAQKNTANTGQATLVTARVWLATVFANSSEACQVRQELLKILDRGREFRATEAGARSLCKNAGLRPYD